MSKIFVNIARDYCAVTSLSLVDINKRNQIYFKFIQKAISLVKYSNRHKLSITSCIIGEMSQKLRFLLYVLYFCYIKFYFHYIFYISVTCSNVNFIYIYIYIYVLYIYIYIYDR